MSSQNLDGLYFEFWISVELGNDRKRVGFCDIVLVPNTFYIICRISSLIVAGKSLYNFVLRNAHFTHASLPKYAPNCCHMHCIFIDLNQALISWPFCDNCLKFIDHCSLDIQVIMRWFKMLREITLKKCHESRLLFTPLRLMMRLLLGTTTQGDDLKHRLLNPNSIWRLVSYAQELNFNPCSAWKWKWWDCNIGGIFFENCNTFAA